jgi:hypothetical protein
MSNPPFNPINVRLPQFELASDEGRQAAHRYLASGIVDLNQAIAALSNKVSTATPSTTTIIQSGSGGGGGGGGLVVGGVNDQIGQTSYTTQQSDYGTKIIIGDSSPVIVSLDGGITTPWFTIIDNDSSSVASLTPISPSLLDGERFIGPGCFGIIYYDGANFWCGATKIATNSSMGYVQPDVVTIRVDSGMLHTIGATGTIPLGPFLDSSMTSIFVHEGLITGWLHTP